MAPPSQNLDQFAKRQEYSASANNDQQHRAGSRANRMSYPSLEQAPSQSPGAQLPGVTRSVTARYDAIAAEQLEQRTAASSENIQTAFNDADWGNFFANANSTVADLNMLGLAQGFAAPIMPNQDGPVHGSDVEGGNDGNGSLDEALSLEELQEGDDDPFANEPEGDRMTHAVRAPESGDGVPQRRAFSHDNLALMGRVRAASQMPQITSEPVRPALTQLTGAVRQSVDVHQISLTPSVQEHAQRRNLVYRAGLSPPYRDHLTPSTQVMRAPATTPSTPSPLRQESTTAGLVQDKENHSAVRRHAEDVLEPGRDKRLRTEADNVPDSEDAMQLITTDEEDELIRDKRERVGRSISALSPDRRKWVQFAYEYFKIDIMATNPFPSSLEVDKMVHTALDKARVYCGQELGLTIPPNSITPLVMNLVYLRVAQIRGICKTCARGEVNKNYDLITSPSGPADINTNREIIAALATGSSFLWKDYRNTAVPGTFFEASAFKHIINHVLFGNEHRSLAVKFGGSVFSEDIPLPTIALVATAMHCALDEWKTGSFVRVNFSEKIYGAVYYSYLEGLEDWKTFTETQGTRQTAALQKALWTSGRLFAKQSLTDGGAPTRMPLFSTAIFAQNQGIVRPSSLT